LYFCPLSLSFYQNSSTVNSFTGPNRYPVVTSLIHIDSRKPPQCCLMIAGEGFPFVIVNTKEYHSDVLANITMILRRTLDNSL
ncbi:hypothetical protein Tco_0247633, partial [Tanacetum coccineum]